MLMITCVLFSTNVSMGFMCASFLMSLFLMWSNLVLPIAHLNILILAELSLLSSFFLVSSTLAVNQVPKGSFTIIDIYESVHSVR